MHNKRRQCHCAHNYAVMQYDFISLYSTIWHTYIPELYSQKCLNSAPHELEDNKYYLNPFMVELKNFTVSSIWILIEDVSIYINSFELWNILTTLESRKISQSISQKLISLVVTNMHIFWPIFCVLLFCDIFQSRHSSDIGSSILIKIYKFLKLIMMV